MAVAHWQWWPVGSVLNLQRNARERECQYTQTIQAGIEKNIGAAAYNNTTKKIHKPPIPRKRKNSTTLLYIHRRIKSSTSSSRNSERPPLAGLPRSEKCQETSGLLYFREFMNDLSILSDSASMLCTTFEFKSDAVQNMVWNTVDITSPIHPNIGFLCHQSI